MLFWRGKAAAILYAAIIFTVTFIAGTADVFAAQLFLYLTTGSMNRVRRITALLTIIRAEE